MPFQLTDDEYRLVQNLPEDELVDLAVELDILVEAQMDHRSLYGLCVQGLAELASQLE